MLIYWQRESKAFTLVEVMVSLLIFTIASMGLLPLLITNLQVNHGNSLHSQAQRLASEVMTKLQVIDYADLTAVADAPLSVGNVEVQQQIEQNRPQADQSTITVTARWQQQGRSQHYQLQTIRSAP